MSAFHALSAFKATVYYWSALYTWIFRQNRYTDNEHFFAGDVHAHVQVYSLALIFVMWDMPHYRSRSYQQDMLDNLRNVAIPATGIPLSVFCHSWWFCLFFVFFVNPCVCFLGACNKVRVYGGGIQQLWFHYREHLLHPQDWFSFWQLNCRLASFHSQKLRAKGFALEDKWTFLKEGAAAGVPVSPFYTSPRRMVVKNKNIEGGMGIYFFDNAVHGGDYILQAELQNADWLATLLPSRAPLSTLRIITSSSWTMARFGHKIAKKEFKSALALGANDFRDPQKNKHCDSRTGNTCEQNEGPASAFELQSSSANILRNRKKRENVPGKPGSKDEMFSTDQYENISSAEAAKYVTARSAVLRLGRAGASTDHSSVLFDVDIASGAIREGRSNAHWYKLGPSAVFSCPWLPQDGFTQHPDTPDKPPVTGQRIPSDAFAGAVDIVVQAHYNLLRDVPMVGWDVAFCQEGIFLLEVNLSCNFFRATFDTSSYLAFVDDHFRDLQNR